MTTTLKQKKSENLFSIKTLIYVSIIMFSYYLIKSMLGTVQNGAKKKKMNNEYNVYCIAENIC